MSLIYLEMAVFKKVSFVYVLIFSRRTSALSSTYFHIMKDFAKIVHSSPISSNIMKPYSSVSSTVSMVSENSAQFSTDIFLFDNQLINLKNILPVKVTVSPFMEKENMSLVSDANFRVSFINLKI